MGSVSLRGQDILDLNYGSVVPLDRSVGEPVDLVLEGRAIAQGEIVLINGKNLGVRIVAVNK
jgi:flagellar motor switch protein FliN/FliY